MKVIGEKNINVVFKRLMPVFGELNERIISIEQARNAVNEIKSSEAKGPDVFPVECLMKVDMAVFK